MRTVRAALPAAFAVLLLAPLARPQDSHYWTNQYGTRATLLGGAVIGSVLDLSGTYYNPGGMSLIEKPQTLMAANIFQFPRVTLTGADVETVPLNRFHPGPAPTLVAGTIRLRGLPGHWFGYSYLSRQSVKFGVSASGTGSHEALPGLPGPEQYVSQYRLDEKLAETWLGLTWSHKLSKHIGLGATQYLVYRNHRASTQELVEALAGGESLAVALGARQYAYIHFRILWKIGLAFDFAGVTLGLTLTTPSLAIGGRGTTGVNSSLAGLDSDGDGVADDFLAAGYRHHLPMTYRSPFSLAAGMTFKIQKVRVYWSAEWFHRVSPYTVIDAPEFNAQSTGEEVSIDVTQELAAVLNWGTGVEWLYSSRFKGYASLTTDYSAKNPRSLTNLSLTDWDIHHVVTGGEFMINKSSFTVGLGLSFGGREIGARPAAIIRDGPNGLWDPLQGLRFRFSTYKLILGFAI
ncbi:MAG: hypothetical protein JW775_09565 [Candidatus Aminicenantes bacterium]|nr:hypothetical protein [Candidatus Aminicenantes bacterium]